MAGFSGISGLIAKDAANIPFTRKWSVSTKNDLQGYSASNTAGGMGRLAGNDDFSGSYDAYGHTPAVKPGDMFTFHGSMDGVDGVSGPCIVDSVTINWDIEGGKPISHSVDFSANGALTLGAEAAVADASVPNPPTSIGTLLKFITVETASPATVTLADLRTMALKISRANPEYRSSSTSGHTKRVAGVFDCELSCSFYIGDPDFSDIPTIGTIFQIKAYVDATTFWDIKWMRLASQDGLDVDREGGGVVGASLAFMLAGYANVGAAPGTPTAGYVKSPAVATWWP